MQRKAYNRNYITNDIPGIQLYTKLRRPQEYTDMQRLCSHNHVFHIHNTLPVTQSDEITVTDDAIPSLKPYYLPKSPKLRIKLMGIAFSHTVCD